MAYDFDSINLPKIDIGGIIATTKDDGSVQISAPNDKLRYCITIKKMDATILAKFLAEVYLEVNMHKEPGLEGAAESDQIQC